ncbi:MAG: hypothetical protein M3O62_04800 [Pseudomonadota bacterium]|nr:hypothetical protein [Pseudomonadota bacterium]
MQITLLVLLVIAVAGFAWLLQRLKQQQQLLDTLLQDQQALNAAWNALPPDAAQLANVGAASFMSLEILNPVELAAKESSFAGPLGNIAPGLLRKIVYQRAAAIIREDLLKHGVQAEVKIHGLA